MSITERARRLRRDSTRAERLLWRHLRDRRLGGHKFRRQYPVGIYVADFACEAEKLIVEVDGGQHNPAVDAKREAALAGAGYRVVRFWNHEVLSNTEGVLQRLLEELSKS